MLNAELNAGWWGEQMDAISKKDRGRGEKVKTPEDGVQGEWYFRTPDSSSSGFSSSFEHYYHAAKILLQVTAWVGVCMSACGWCSHQYEAQREVIERQKTLSGSDIARSICGRCADQISSSSSWLPFIACVDFLRCTNHTCTAAVVGQQRALLHCPPPFAWCPYAAAKHKASMIASDEKLKKNLYTSFLIAFVIFTHCQRNSDCYYCYCCCCFVIEGETAKVARKKRMSCVEYSSVWRMSCKHLIFN